MNRLRAIVFGLLAASLALPAAAGDADVRAACHALVIDYAYYRDRGDADAFGNLFTADARLEVLGEVWNGRTAIRERLQTPPEATPLLRHHMTTIRITPQGNDRAVGVSYAAIYAGPPGAEAPHPQTGLAAVGEYHDQFQRTSSGWT